MNFRGAWMSTTTYAVNDAVTENGATFIAVVANVGHNPATDSGTHWKLLAAAGTTGATGAAGAKGANGTNGNTGATGPQGPVGPLGPSCANGTTGPREGSPPAPVEWREPRD